jgi:hypothetical protein
MTRYLEIKPGSISETIKRLSDDYQAIFKKELEKTGKGIGSMTPDEKKAFFNKIDKMHNAKNEAMDSSWIKKEIDKEKKTTLVAAPGNKEKVIRIPKEKLADYKAKGYVEAESYIPEAKKVKEEELTAGQKKLPPALQKAIEKKDKKEETELEEACWTGYKKVGMKKKGDRMVPNCVPEGYVTESGDIVEFVELDEGQFKDIDIRKGDLKLAKDKKEQLKNKYNAMMANQAQGDENAIADQIQKLDMSIKKQEQQLIDIMKKQKETKKEEVETVSEYTGPDRLTNLNDKITKLQVNISKLDMSKPENKTKEAIMKADLTTAKLRLQDVIQKKNTETKKESVNEAKKTYKSIKKSVKKEQDKEVNSKRTLTDKPLTKVDVDPKIEN